KAEELATRFDKKPRYFLDIFFQGSAHMVNHHEKVNTYNMFKSLKAADHREGMILFNSAIHVYLIHFLEGASGIAAPELHNEYKAEYNMLTEEQKEELMRCDTPRTCIQDVSNTVRNIQMLFHGLSYRVGIEGFFCIVRNSPDFFMAPQWYFTSKELEWYMPIAVHRRWDTGETGTRLEAFAIAGCDTMSTCIYPY
ncbi:hypothetical protein C8J57DRAFT_1066654, partial [Mycena rebaudengoi]